VASNDSSREWVILSKDQYNYLERLAIKNARGRAFLLVPGGLKGTGRYHFQGITRNAENP
jgi:hypothetical protein